MEKFGQVSIEEVSLASKIAAADSSIAAVKQHAQYFDFYLVPIKFGVIGFDGKTCKWMQFGATLRVPGADAGQAFTPERIPGHQFEEGFSGSGCQADRFQRTQDRNPGNEPDQRQRGHRRIGRCKVELESVVSAGDLRLRSDASNLGDSMRSAANSRLAR